MKMKILCSAILMLLIILTVGVYLWFCDNDDDWGNFA